jgi:hypothetical protein
LIPGFLSLLFIVSAAISVMQDSFMTAPTAIISILLSILSVVDPATARGLKEGKKTPRGGLSYPAPDSDFLVASSLEEISPPGLYDLRPTCSENFFGINLSL